ncbi:tyrosine-type recombinase/integrase [Shouchella miscanthi]|uniref:Tyrosine-type recombinase/integrase n=1 Tax=Shouchella miscanthi TaxID=2598861 RepID=A0ABU6NVA3_9BACI|nr:tyrosine-type recombinase/integrase [Shouchella miscanthi]MED4130742.1 tyrosine-type recombinase/integrase [Shouchella miscanthi]
MAEHTLISEAFNVYFASAEEKLRPKTVHEYKKDIEQFKDYLGIKYPHVTDINAITIDHLQEYLSFLIIEKKCMVSTRNRRKNTLRSVWKFLFKVGIVDENIAIQLEHMKERVVKSERPFLTEDEINELLNAIDSTVVRGVVLVLYYTGMRISECLNLTMTDIDFESQKARVIDSKGGKSRTIPINGHLKDILKTYTKRNHIQNKVFFTRSGGLTDRYVNKCLKQATNKLHWNTNVTCHTFRHSFASNLFNKGVHIVTIQKLLGHANLQTTSGYTHITQQSAEEAVELLETNGHLSI